MSPLERKIKELRATGPLRKDFPDEAASSVSSFCSLVQVGDVASLFERGEGPTP